MTYQVDSSLWRPSTYGKLEVVYLLRLQNVRLCALSKAAQVFFSPGSFVDNWISKLWLHSHVPNHKALLIGIYTVVLPVPSCVLDYSIYILVLYLMCKSLSWWYCCSYVDCSTTLTPESLFCLGRMNYVSFRVQWQNVQSHNVHWLFSINIDCRSEFCPDRPLECATILLSLKFCCDPVDTVYYLIMLRE